MSKPAAMCDIYRMKAMASLLLLAALAGSCTKPKDLEFVDISGVRVLELGLVQSSIGVDVKFYNPNNQRISLKEAAVDIFLNDKFVGKTRLDSLIRIPKRDTFTIPLVVRVETMNALNNAVGSLSDSTVNVRLAGSARMGKAGVFFNYPINYKGTQKVRL
jgi:LEA14-like dessication related protein